LGIDCGFHRPLHDDRLQGLAVLLGIDTVCLGLRELFAVPDNVVNRAVRIDLSRLWVNAIKVFVIHGSPQKSKKHCGDTQYGEAKHHRKHCDYHPDHNVKIVHFAFSLLSIARTPNAVSDHLQTSDTHRPLPASSAGSWYTTSALTTLGSLLTRLITFFICDLSSL
jgi:hypothetical protein